MVLAAVALLVLWPGEGDATRRAPREVPATTPAAPPADEPAPVREAAAKPTGVSGVVVRPDGRAVPDVAVGAGQLRVVSGLDGRFSFPGLTGKFTLKLADDDWVLLSRVEDAVAPVDHLRLVVARPRRLLVRVRDAAGRPVRRAHVEVRPHDAGWPGVTLGPSRLARGWADGQTDARGERVLDDVPDAPCDLVVSARRYPRAEPVAVPADVEEIEVRFGARYAEARLVCRVEDRAGQPIADAQVHARSSVDYRRWRTHDDGRVELRLLCLRYPDSPAYHDLEVLVAAEGFTPRLLTRPDLEPGETHLTVALEPERVLAGRVVPPARRQFRLHSDRDDRKGTDWLVKLDNAWHQTDEEGRFRIGQLWEGEFQLFDGDALFTVRAPREDLVLRMADGAVALVWFTLHVRDASTGQPVTHCMIVESTGGGLLDDAPDGVYAMPARLPGPRALGVKTDRYAYWYLPLRDWSAGAYRLDVALEPAAPLHVRVVDAAGAPVAGARVLPQDVAGHPLSFDDKTPLRAGTELPRTDLGGRCWFELVRRGPARLAIYPPGAETPQLVAVDVGANENELVVRLGR